MSTISDVISQFEEYSEAVLDEVAEYKEPDAASFSSVSLQEIYDRLVKAESVSGRLDSLLFGLWKYKSVFVSIAKSLELTIESEREKACKSMGDGLIKKGYAQAEREIFYSQATIDSRILLGKVKGCLESLEVLCKIVESRLKFFSSVQYNCRVYMSILETSKKIGEI